MTNPDDPYAPPPGQSGGPESGGFTGPQPGQSGYGPPPGYAPPPGYGQHPGGYGGPGWGQPADSTNGMAVASLVLGILWLFWVGSVLALVFGYLAKSQMRQRPQQGGGMATAGIVLGWIGVAMFAFFFILGVIAGFTGGDYTGY